MNILLYATSKFHLERSLFFQRLESLSPEKPLSKFSTIPAFLEALKIPFSKWNIVILCPTDTSDLEKLVSFQQYLSDLQLIIVLPNQNKITISLAHKLYPRFVTSRDESLEYIIPAVVAKMINSINGDK